MQAAWLFNRETGHVLSSGACLVFRQSGAPWTGFVLCNNLARVIGPTHHRPTVGTRTVVNDVGTWRASTSLKGDEDFWFMMKNWGGIASQWGCPCKCRLARLCERRCADFTPKHKHKTEQSPRKVWLMMRLSWTRATAAEQRKVIFVWKGRRRERVASVFTTAAV